MTQGASVSQTKLARTNARGSFRLTTTNQTEMVGENLQAITQACREVLLGENASSQSSQAGMQPTTPPGKHMSAAARARISQAMKERHRKEAAQKAKEAAQKAKQLSKAMSASG